MFFSFSFLYPPYLLKLNSDDNNKIKSSLLKAHKDGTKLIPQLWEYTERAVMLKTVPKLNPMLVAWLLRKWGICSACGKPRICIFHSVPLWSEAQADILKGSSELTVRCSKICQISSYSTCQSWARSWVYMGLCLWVLVRSLNLIFRFLFWLFKY